MFLFIGKTILLYILTIVIIRIMGKSAFAQLTAHDLAGILFVVTLAIGPLMTENLTYAIVGLIVVSVLHIAFSKLTLFNWLDKIFIGEPTIVIKHGKLIKANLKRSRFALAELLSSIREKGYPDVALIDYAIIEPNGELSILPKQEAAPVTPKQLKIETVYQGLPIAVIIEGKIQHQNLKLINKNEEWLKKELASAGYPDQTNIFYGAVRDHDSLLTIDTGDGRGKSLT
ncbi:DUF421 domain-containing protein [Halobacillus shinanisalinarum]|uniref:DUF421 domain-containing protein n=1 Tax=Halobacillus shinanisalinarum TaxID=2932258 RepID=A0ABY4GY65_9BACI|nr:DUF421 domain-containing protein [Halobacillus shinanisalinarum]UOQ92865.1 DUF421 domain-containing protein [Halobacillus shinanisalinarum]